MDQLRRFSLSFAVVTLFLTILLGVLITRLYEGNAIEQAKGALARSVQTEAGHELTEADFSSPRYGQDYDKVRESLKDLLRMPGVLLTLVFSPDGTVVWSDYPVLIGRSYTADPNLASSLRGNVRAAIIKPEEEGHPFPRQVKELMELYVPVALTSPSRVSGVVEIYQDMAPLRSSIFRVNMMVSGLLLAGFAALYLLLFRMVRRGYLLFELN